MLVPSCLFRSIALTWLAVAAAMFGAGPALAQMEYPLRPIHLIVTFNSGGSADFTARALAERLSLKWRQQVVVENRTGAGGNIGADVVAKAPPDGYMLLLGSNTLAFNVALYSHLPFDLMKDFVYLGTLTASPNLLAVNPRITATNLQEFTSMRKAHPGELSYATCGVATAQHFAMELYKFNTQTSAVHVPYRGCAPAVVDTVAGQIDIVIASDTAVLPQTKVGKLRPIAMTSAARSPSAPAIPTFAESGIAALKDYDAEVVYGLMGPAGLPAVVQAKIQADVAQVMAEPDLQARLEQAGLDLRIGSGSSMTTLMRADIERFRGVIQFAGIKPE